MGVVGSDDLEPVPQVVWGGGLTLISGILPGNQQRPNENHCLEDEFPIWGPLFIFRGYVSIREFKHV